MKYKSARSLYNVIYKNYHDYRSKGVNDVTELPTVLKLLGNIKNKSILDMGCGFGRHAKEFINRGGKVTGFDASEKMVTLAKNYCNSQGTFFRGDFEKVSFENNSFDYVNASLSVIYSNKLEIVFNNVANWLKPHGIFTFSIIHPLWYFKKMSEMDFSTAKKVVFTITSYDVEIYNYYYPLDYYINLINSNRYKLLNMVETTIPKRIKGYDEAKYRIPNTIVFKVQKI